MANVQANMSPVGGVQPAVAQPVVGISPAIHVQQGQQQGNNNDGLGNNDGAVQTVPDNYMILAWFSCLCCCWPIGLVAIYNSCNVDRKWARGDFQGAILSSHNAKTASKVAIGGGIVLFIIAVIARL